jgi:DNA-binding IclR family transcriptional regulator
MSNIVIQKPQKSVSLQTLDRALELLDILANSTVPMSASELSKRMGINRTTNYAMLNSLSKHDHIKKDPVTGKYIIGYKMFELGQLFRRRFPFLRIAQSHAFKLTEKWNFNVYISIYIGGGEIMLLTDDYPAELRVLNEGSRGPATATAMGKVLLANMPENVLMVELEKMTFIQYTPNTITNKKQFLMALNRIRKQGYAFDDQEYITGMSCFAAPIRDHGGHILAAISLSGAAEKIVPNQEQVIKDIIIAARSISAA